MMASHVKRLKRSTTASPFQRTTSAQSNQWNRRFKTSKAIHDDDIKIIFQNQDPISPNEDPLFKSAKDGKQVNARYQKLMDEENLLLQDLRKLQVKKQLLIKRSRQLKDEEIFKLNTDLQKEKEIRVDLGKKFSALEKKLNQLEKEIEDRNRNKSIALKDNTSYLTIKDDLKGFKSLSLSNTTNQSRPENIFDKVILRKNKRNSNLINLTDNQINDKSNEQISIKKSFCNLAVKSLPKIKTESTNIEAKLSNKINVPKNFAVGPLLLSKTNSETNTQLTSLQTKTNSTLQSNLTNLPKDQQSGQNNLNNVIRDILDRRLSNETQPQQNSNSVHTDSITINPEICATNIQRKDQQQNNLLNDQNIHDIFDDMAIGSNTTTASNLSTTNQAATSDESRESNLSISDQVQSPTTMNPSNSSSSSW